CEFKFRFFHSMAYFLKRLYTYFFKASVEKSDSQEKDSPPRPICIRGALKGVIERALIKKHSELFEVGKETTSCSERKDDYYYHFSPEFAMLDAIRYRQFIDYYTEDGDLYGLRRNTVRKIMEQGRHCILHIKYARSLLRLKLDVEPIVIYVHSAPEQIIEWRAIRGKSASFENAVHSLFENEEWERKSFEHAITHEIVAGKSFNDVVQKVIDICIESRHRPETRKRENTVSISSE
ncbi:hypothetical protein PFISCL1PPCAC_11884, partial [Pristionchus fissidentatus]